ncbi:thiopeptide-type bacteriocin biosynthesis protein [Nonomuraea polychroma]|uniref:thiopeptide-type bacteriocin biosynthesis protein n=1 Tax=Nonomuraea polychroma TaxID=46176 RepID=UPI003D90A29B
MDTLCQQINVAFPTWDDAEAAALTHVAPLLEEADAHGLITLWWFIRKAPCWRVRYLPAADTAAAEEYLRRHLADLASAGHILSATRVIYEPEVRAFGGAEAMDCAHQLFHSDSRHLLDHLTSTRHQPDGGHRCELAILLCSVLMRAAGQDWYEQGDIWARVAAHREPALPHLDLHEKLRRLMSVDITTLCRPGAALADVAAWADAFSAAGSRLGDLAAEGRLHRGLRDILAHHVIFTWNRHGLPHETQAVLARTAATVVFGDDPATSGPPTFPARSPSTCPTHGS